VTWSVSTVGRAPSPQPKPPPKELSTDQAEVTLGELTSFPKPLLVVLTDGDPFKRAALASRPASTVCDQDDRGPALPPVCASARRRSAPAEPVIATSHCAARPTCTNDGRVVMFVSHTGPMFPSGFLPIECGRCEYRWICGGSRARAYAVASIADPQLKLPKRIIGSCLPTATNPRDQTTSPRARPHRHALEVGDVRAAGHQTTSPRARPHRRLYSRGLQALRSRFQGTANNTAN